jgi:hypothetical protein
VGVRTLLAVLPLLDCVALVELNSKTEAAGASMKIRDLLALLPLNEAVLLFQGMNEAALGMSVRDLVAQTSELQNLREQRDDAMPDLREILERLRALNGLHVAPLFQRYHLRLAELYYRKGRRTEFAPLQRQHLENKVLEQRYRLLLAQLKTAADESRLRGRNTTEGSARAEELTTLRQAMRESKRIWVVTENRFGDMQEAKTKLEAFLESMRLKLLGVLRNPAKFLQHPQRFQKLEHQIVVLNQELERDNDLYKEMKHYASYTYEARRSFTRKLNKAEGKMQLAWRFPPSTSGESTMCAAFELLLQNYSKVFGSSPRVVSHAAVDQFLLCPILRLEQAQLLGTSDLYGKRDPVSDKQAAQIEAYARKAYQLDLSRVSNPHTLTAAVFRALASQSALLPNDSLQLGQTSDNEARRIALAQVLVNKMPSSQLITLKVLLSHLLNVLAKSASNKMTLEKMSKTFAPLLFK